MKIISWNIGSFIWLKHFPGRKHQCFQVENLDKIQEIIKKENADIIFLQELMTEDIGKIINAFPELIYHRIINTENRISKILLLSKYPFVEVEHPLNNYFIINSINFLPIHLDAFSPRRRLLEIKSLLKDFTSKKSIILGDTNLWIFNKYFSSKLDKKSYLLFLEDFIDTFRFSNHTTRMFLPLDKIFISKDLESKNPKIIKDKIRHMDHYLISLEILYENKK